MVAQLLGELVGQFAPMVVAVFTMAVGSSLVVRFVRALVLHSAKGWTYEPSPAEVERQRLYDEAMRELDQLDGTAPVEDFRG